MKKRLLVLFLLLTQRTLCTGLLALPSPPASPFRSANNPTGDDPTEAAAARISYTLSMPQPQTHYFEVDMRLQNAAAATNARKNGYIDLKMPVWTPGSYLIREYAKNVEGFTATAGGQPVRSDKINKNTWRVYTNADDVQVHYRVYSFEFSVRNSYLDDQHGYLNGASMFLYNDALKNQPLTVQINPFTGWKKVATGMKAVTGTPFTYEAPNYDILVDSPIEIGNHTALSFTVANPANPAQAIPHTVAMFANGPLDYNAEKLTADYKRICETAATVVGEHPCTDYTFLVHHTSQPGGGLEHLNSTTLQTTLNAYATERSYKGFLTLVAHEYFHLWNVKRIRPIALGPFDYETENYTHMLWLSEGCTSFYEDYILRRAGFHTPEEYLKIVAGDITGIENQPGNQVQSAAEASWDAWIKNYRPNENSANSTISYYSKGSVLGTLLNLAILSGSNGQRSMDDLLRLLYNDYYKKQKRGFTDDEFRRAAEQMAGTSLASFFDKGVNGTGTIDYDTYFAPVGLRLVNTGPPSTDGYFGASVAPSFNPSAARQVIASVRRGSPAEQAGVNVGDIILSIDGNRLTDELSKQLAGKKPGETVRLSINRGGQPRELSVQLGTNPLVSYRLEALPNVSDKQKSLYSKWLYIK
ncbi:M61 family metallopeptidase [uncultured Fibrella sp.]|uniref:M61 family metallopeptidase n=1 Tax=uncultured Fibrella sp. TaxID=1284596 RepID=UPI0035CA4CB9